MIVQTLGVGRSGVIALIFSRDGNALDGLDVVSGVSGPAS